MSCNCTCNTTSKCNNDPCAICTPPGVTGLTTCKPVDPCDEKVNIECVKYNGIDFSCLNVKNGDDLISVLIAILNYYFPPSYCCKLEGEITSFPLTTTTTTSSTTSTSTSTTSTSSTTTTTTATPCVCYKLTNDNITSTFYSYVDCATRQTVVSSVNASSIKYQCAVDKSIVQGNLILDTIGPCSQGCPATTSTTTTSSTTTSSTTTSSTTTTTTSGPCNCYKIVNTENTILYYTYTECGNNPNNLLPPSGTPIAPGETDYICAVPGSIVLDIGLVLTNLGICSLGCPPSPPPPPDINCTQTENFVVYNGSSQNIINNVIGTFFTWPGGPVLPNEVVRGIHGTYTGPFDVDITWSLGAPTGCLKVLVNNVLQDFRNINGSLVYTLDISVLDSDCVQIILTDTPC